MIKYITRPNVVLTELAGEYALVAFKASLRKCPYITQLNETSAFLWRKLEQGSTLDALEAAIGEEYEIDDPAAARAAIEGFVKQMEELNYLKVLST